MSNDLIKRSDAIKAYNEAMDELVKWQMEEWQLGDFSECEFNTTDCKHIVRKLEAIPSADRPQGEWIRDRYWSRGVGMGEEYGFFYKCSLCEYEVENGYTRCGFNFCPYCGADMRKEK